MVYKSKSESYTIGDLADAKVDRPQTGDASA